MTLADLMLTHPIGMELDTSQSYSLGKVYVVGYAVVTGGSANVGAFRIIVRAEGGNLAAVYAAPSNTAYYLGGGSLRFADDTTLISDMNTRYAIIGGLAYDAR